MKNNKLKSILFSSCFCGLALASCSPKHSFSWSGEWGTFTRDYTQYPEPTIGINNTLPIYISQENFISMLEQDVACCLCNNKQMKSYLNISCKLQIDGFDKTSHRLSLYWLLSSDDEKIYEMEITQLYYVPLFNENDGKLFFVPKHFSFLNSLIIVDEDFWKTDPNFKILLNDYKEETTYEFSYRQQSDEEKFKFQEYYSYFLVIEPFFYQNTFIEK